MLQPRVAISDDEFDRVFPASQRYRSPVHWTPIEVAVRVAALFAPSRPRSVLDVGAGVGKLCLVGALTTPSTWYGIERDLRMVRAAELAARRLGISERARFIVGEAGRFDWSSFDAFYLYNPFAEALFGDGDPAIRQAAYLEDVAVVERKLGEARPGARVVTYHGFGGALPACFDLVHREHTRDDALCVWVRRRHRRA